MKKFLLALLIGFLSMSQAFAKPIPVAVIIEDTLTATRTDQIILVAGHELSLWNKHRNGWKSELQAHCDFGKNGFSANRHAGDKTTPVGSFPLLYAFGTLDHPDTNMTYKKITPHSYLSAEYDTYNTWIESAREISGEHLIDYYQYKYAMNIGFNINPTVYGRGAAIFLHCKSTDRTWTSGCVSVEENVMADLFRLVHDGAYILIAPSIEEVARVDREAF